MPSARWHDHVSRRGCRWIRDEFEVYSEAKWNEVIPSWHELVDAQSIRTVRSFGAGPEAPCPKP